MQISVRTLGAEEVVALIADPAETVHSIQSRAACAFGKAPGRARMVFRDGILPCSVSLSDVGVMDGYRHKGDDKSFNAGVWLVAGGDGVLYMI